MAKILLVGDDLSLLSVRAAVLAKTGASTVCCNRREFDRELNNDRFDLVVLCHSLNQDAWQWIATETRRRWPQARVLLVTEENFPPGSIECHADAVIASLHPAQLVLTAAALLAKQPIGPWRETGREPLLRAG